MHKVLESQLITTIRNYQDLKFQIIMADWKRKDSWSGRNQERFVRQPRVAESKEPQNEHVTWRGGGDSCTHKILNYRHE